MMNPNHPLEKPLNFEGNLMKRGYRLLLPFCALVILFLVAACSTSDEREQVLTMEITESNDSLLTYDSLIITVHSKDGSFSQVVFHDSLRNAQQVREMPLDPRVGQDYTVTVVGYKNGKMGLNKEVTFIGNGAQSKDIPIKQDVHETVMVDQNLPEVLVPSDTSIAEDDSLRFRVSVRNPWSGATSLTLKDVIPGAALDTSGRDPGDSYFTWRPNYDQGRSEPYAITFIYASTNKKVERIARVKVTNVNRPPKVAAIPDQKAKENESLSFKVEASDPDHDSLTLTATDLPTGAAFSGGNFTWKPSEGQVGNYTVKFRAFDGSDSGLVAVLITVGNVDIPPPVTVKITSPAQDTSINFTPITILYTVNGTPLQKKIPLKDGKNRIRIDTTIQNRAGFDTILITLDTIPPLAPIVTGASPIRMHTPTWNWMSGGNGIGIYRYHLDSKDMSASIISGETAYTAPEDLDVGIHTLYVQERDAAGNWSESGKYVVRIDTTKPSPPQVTVSPTSPTNNSFPTWGWSSEGDDFSGLYRYKLDTNDFRTGAVETKAIRFTPDKALKEGVHSLYVQQQDSAGNWSISSSAAIVLDLTPPEKPKLTPAQPGPVNESRPTWAISSSESGPGFFRVKLDDSDFTQGAKSGSFLTFIPNSPLGNGIHVLYAQERDSAGNWSAIQASPIVLDLVAPAAPIFDPTPLSPLNSIQPSWTWKGGGGGMGTFRYKLDDSDFSLASDLIRAGKFKPATQLSEGTHVLFVQERDSAGNWSKTAFKQIILSLRGIVGKPGFSNGTVVNTSIAVNKSGIPYVAFADEGDSSKATVMKFNGISWENVGTHGFSYGGVGYPFLAIDNSDVPYLAFMDDAHDGKISVVRFNSVWWDPVGAPGFSDGGIRYATLALDEVGTPYVAFSDNSQGGKLVVMRYANSSWNYVGSRVISIGSAGEISIAINKSGIPYVAYSDDGVQSKSTVLRFNGNSWESVGVPGFSQGIAIFNSLSFNSSGTPFVGYSDVGLGNQVVVKRFTGTSWEIVGSSRISEGVSSFTSLAIGKNDMPCIAYSDNSQGYKASVKCFNDSAWVEMGYRGTTEGIAFNTSLAINAFGVPYVSFCDASNGYKISVIKTAFDP
jgi:hypothetical protein